MPGGRLGRLRVCFCCVMVVAKISLPRISLSMAVTVFCCENDLGMVMVTWFVNGLG